LLFQDTKALVVPGLSLIGQMGEKEIQCPQSKALFSFLRFALLFVSGYS